MFGQSKSEAMKERAESGAALAAELARDKKFRKELLGALEHGVAAREQARRRSWPLATANRLASDEDLRAHLRDASRNLRRAKRRVEKKRSHRLRNRLMFGSAAAIVAIPQTRRWLGKLVGMLNTRILGGSSAGDSPTDVEADKPMSRMTKQELIERAREEDLPVTDEMSRDEVYEALRSHGRA